MKNLKNIKRFYKFFLTPAIIIFLVIVLAVLVLIPRIKTTVGLKKEVEDQQAKLLVLTGKLSDLEGIDEYSLNEKSKIILKILPSQKDVLQPVSVFNQISYDKQVLIESLEVSPGEVSTGAAKFDGDKLESLIFKIKSLGTWKRTLDFLSEIERSLPLMNIKTFKINNSGQVATLELDVESFRSSLPTFTRKLSAPVPKLEKKDDEIIEFVKDFKFYDEVQMSGIPESVTGSVSGTLRLSPFSF